MGSRSMTRVEEQELKRVFAMLCSFSEKHKVSSKLVPLKVRRERIYNHKKKPEDLIVFDLNGKAMKEEDIDEELITLESEIAGLESQMGQVEEEASDRITIKDLQECLKKLGKVTTKKEVEDMVWEVDENLDGEVDWDEFDLTFQRNIADTTGLEPSQLFTLIQFLVYDRDESGKVTIDETMQMLYSRYGKDRLEGQMKKLFGDDLLTEDGDGQLSFTEYLQAVGIKIKPHDISTVKKKNRK